MAKVFYLGIGTREATPLSRIEKVWADIARTTLLPFRNRDVVKSITLGGERADRLEMAICEALVHAYHRGRDDEKLDQRIGADK